MARKPTETQRTILREISGNDEYIRVRTYADGGSIDRVVHTWHGVNPESPYHSTYYIQARTFNILWEQKWIAQNPNDGYWYITDAGRTILSESNHAR